MKFQMVSAVLALAATAIAAPTENAAMASVSKRVTHDGLGTVYTQQGGTGSCGQTNPDSAHIIALSNYWMNNQSPGPYCGRKIQITNTGSNDGVGGKGNTIIATVEDTCPGCDENHLDLSVASWNLLTSNAAYGTVNIEWHFCNANGQC